MDQIKRALTDLHPVCGIGNVYSDEILHRARLSPVPLTQKLDDAELQHLFEAAQSVRRERIEPLRVLGGDAFPEGVTWFRPGMATHRRLQMLCPVCGAPVQRIVHAGTETNYGPRCQTGGRLSAGHALRLLEADWPRTVEAMEALRSR